MLSYWSPRAGKLVVTIELLSHKCVDAESARPRMHLIVIVWYTAYAKAASRIYGGRRCGAYGSGPGLYYLVLGVYFSGVSKMGCR